MPSYSWLCVYKQILKLPHVALSTCTFSWPTMITMTLTFQCCHGIYIFERQPLQSLPPISFLCNLDWASMLHVYTVTCIYSWLSWNWKNTAHVCLFGAQESSELLACQKRPGLQQCNWSVYGITCVRHAKHTWPLLSLPWAVWLQRVRVRGYTAISASEGSWAIA